MMVGQFARDSFNLFWLTLLISCLVNVLANHLHSDGHEKGFMVVFPTLINSYNEIVSHDLHSYKQLYPTVCPHFQAFGHNFTLQLIQNNELLTTDFMIEKVTGSRGIDTLRKYDGNFHSDEKDSKERSCFFVGVVKGIKNSSVAVNTCKGLSGVIVLNNDEYYIEPIAIHANRHKNDALPHAFYKRSWMSLPNTDNDDLLVAYENWKDDSEFSYVSAEGVSSTSLAFEGPVAPRRGQRSLRRTPNIETLVVVDKTMVDFHGAKNVKDYVLTVMNMVSNIFRDASIGQPINVVIVRLVIVEKPQKDSFLVSFSAKSTLRSFCLWQKRQNYPGDENPYHHDVALLFTRKDICGIGNFPCASIGMAMQGGMCSNKYSCSIVQDTGLNTAFTVAQMLGHNIGLVSLKRTLCGAFGSGSYIMSPRRLKSPHTNRFKWSSCSRNHLSHILKGRAGKCLLDESDFIDNQNVTLPGQRYNLDDQCRFLHGKNSTFCFSALESVCSTLWCTNGSPNRGCTTNREPAADGSFCNEERTKWCIGGQCVPRVSHPIPVDGQWGSWSEWNACSRTCGGGVQMSIRECDSPRPTYRGASCEGERKKYRICNTNKCPENGISFRDKQCSSYNDKLYRGRFHQWKGFNVKAKECSLFCQSVKSRFYTLMTLNAADGTPCSKSSSYDRCIDGECRKIGCDNVLGSNAKEDICGKCGGKNTDCVLISRQFKKKHGIGYVTVDYIPRGSTSIKIMEKTPSRNYLALETTFGENIINSGYLIERPGVHQRLNSLVEYKREGFLEEILIKGPITKDLKIMVLFQADKSSVAYQYAEQNDINQALFTSRDRFIWKHDNSSKEAWSTCSATCGKGLHHGKFVCLDIFQNSFVDDKLCDKTEKPLFVKPCENLPPCEKPKKIGQWIHNNWGPCSVTCGEGVKRRAVACKEVGTDLMIDENLCPGKKPRNSKKCNRHRCQEETGIWVFGQWQPCSVTCGEGIRNRVVKCMNLAGKMLADSKCITSRKPARVSRCGVPCVKWVAGEWGECPSSCKESQRRCVLCINMHTFTHSKDCDVSEKPQELRTCPSQSCS